MTTLQVTTSISRQTAAITSFHAALTVYLRCVLIRDAVRDGRRTMTLIVTDDGLLKRKLFTCAHQDHRRLGSEQRTRSVAGSAAARRSDLRSRRISIGLNPLSASLSRQVTDRAGSQRDAERLEVDVVPVRRSRAPKDQLARSPAPQGKSFV